MGTPADHLPPPHKDEAIISLFGSIGLAKPTSIISPKVSAEYHRIYMITMNNGIEYVLRVSGNHIPTIKTENEVAVMSWLKQRTTIPIPEVISYDSTCNNPLQREYTLCTRAYGDTMSDIYTSLSQAQLDGFMDQVIDILLQLHESDWTAIGGLKFTNSGTIEMGPVLEETFWQVPDIEAFWPAGETVSSLNIGGPYPSYVAYISAHIRKYIYAIQIHEKLDFMRDSVGRLELFLQALQDHAVELNNVKLKLAHKDLHLANIMYDRETSRITAVLDWEFSGVVPFTRWNPSRAFFWNGLATPKSKVEKDSMMQKFSKRCTERGVTILEDAQFSSPLQEAMQEAATYLRSIVEVAPRGQCQDLVGGWKETVFKNLALFGV
ncbi:hypothetical protein BP6252_00307 [Coleophoma cylindrospora]|uniref:Aminoglycoside phosphotransferase domain-containing protein n=1 Tax=Coleophoma cylindrospora TaxID=1849047 RepID=A0A3D8SPN1_9HELO|nr:hypothetical protein BP6252_00307 [Coleophoma cylindrospora]